jgi:hypothetical protein
MSAFSGQIVIWDPVNNVPIVEGPLPCTIDGSSQMTV